MLRFERKSHAAKKVALDLSVLAITRNAARYLPLLDIIGRFIGIPGPRKDVVEVALNGVVEAVHTLP
jgi:hypothetical protein